MFLLRIPEEARHGIDAIADLAPVEVEQLSKLLTETRPTTSSARSMIQEIKDRVPWQEPKKTQVLDTLFMLLLVGEKQDMDEEEISKILVLSIQADEAFEDWSEERALHFKEIIKDLLSSDNVLKIVAKAEGLLREHQRVLQNIRIISDIRPIFGKDLNRAAGAVITHMLKISYSEEGQIKEFFVAFDTKDLKEMSDTLGRATDKITGLQATLSDANVPNLSEADES